MWDLISSYSPYWLAFFLVYVFCMKENHTCILTCICDEMMFCEKLLGVAIYVTDSYKWLNYICGYALNVFQLQVIGYDAQI